LKEPRRVLVVNAGSQSVKLRVIEANETVAASRDLGPPDRGLEDALADFLDTTGAVDAVGHRVVHGGQHLTSTTLIDAQVRETLASLCELAPLHNGPALAGIDAVASRLPQVPAFACFDTAFHADLPAEAVAYAVPSEWVTQWGIRRYGFHGLSCAWATRRAAQVLDRAVTDLRLVICHLGGGASVTAVAAGKSVDTTMGFTPLEGLVMATRSGDLDPGALLWVLKHGLSSSQAENDLEHRSGLLALSGDRSSDMRELEARRTSGDASAAFAIKVYTHRLRAKVAAMMAACGGADAIIFTGGIGENSAAIRSETCSGLEWLGSGIDESSNAAVAGSDRDVSAPGAPIHTLVVHAREDLQIATECQRALAWPLNDRRDV
jgi:acetate kinase